MMITIVVLLTFLGFLISSSARCCSDPPTTPRPSRAPTISPTRLPSEVPTRKPSRNPTPMPTRLPSIVPTRKPSRAPTIEPSAFPSEEPTYEPSQPSSRPSSAPTTFTPRPTYQPSLYPTPLPTFTPQPSAMPTIMPTPAPSGMPTVVPSSGPTVSPTRFPTPAPSTLAPSTEPTAIPSNMPTINPSNIPTSPPTIQPTISLGPTASPSKVPSMEPTLAPTNMPSIMPSVAPSLSPSTVPSPQPTTSVAFELKMEISQVLGNIDAATFRNSSANYDAFSLAVSSTVDGLKPTDVSITDVTDTTMRFRRYLRDRFSAHTALSASSMHVSEVAPEVSVEYTVSFVVQERGFTDAAQAAEHVQTQLRAAVGEGTFAASLASAAGNVSGADPALRNVTTGAISFLRTDITILRSAAPTAQPTNAPGVKRGGFASWPVRLKAITIFFAVLGFLLVLVAVVVMWKCGDSWVVVCLYCMVSGSTLFHKDLCVMMVEHRFNTATSNDDVVTKQPNPPDPVATTEQADALSSFDRESIYGQPLEEEYAPQSSLSDPGASSRTVLPPEPSQHPPSFLGFVSSTLSHFLPFGPLDVEETEDTADVSHLGATSRNSLDSSVMDEEAQWTAPGEILVDETDLPGLSSSGIGQPLSLAILTHPVAVLPAGQNASERSAEQSSKSKMSPFQSLQSILTGFLRPGEEETEATTEMEVNLPDTYPASSEETVPMQSAPLQLREPIKLELEPVERFHTNDEASLNEIQSYKYEVIDIIEPATPPRSILKTTAAPKESPRTGAFLRMPRVAFRLSTSSTPRASMDGNSPRPDLDPAPAAPVPSPPPTPTTTPGGTLFGMMSTALGLFIPFGAEEDPEQEIVGDFGQDQAPRPLPPPPEEESHFGDEFTERIMSSYRPAPSALGDEAPRAPYRSRRMRADTTSSEPHAGKSLTLPSAHPELSEETITINLSSEPAKKSYLNPFRYFTRPGATSANIAQSNNTTHNADLPASELSTSTKEYISSLSGMHPSSRTSAPWQPQKHSNTSLMQSSEDWSQQSDSCAQMTDPAPSAQGMPHHPPRPPVDKPDTRALPLPRGPSATHFAPSVELRRQYADAPPRISIRPGGNNNNRSPRRPLPPSVPSNAAGGSEGVQSTTSAVFSKPRSLPVKK